MIEYAVSWSGGKDSCFALWKAISQGLKVSYFLNFVNQDATRAMSHGLSPELIALQAQAMRLPIKQQPVTWETYETGFKTALEELKSGGIHGLVTGDIYLPEHREWIERVCGESGVTAALPLWQMEPSRLLADFMAAGFKAIIVSLKADILDKKWLGCQLDSDLVEQFQQLAIDPCGEAGEFHTFVYDGPTFEQPITVTDSTPELRETHWFLNITEYRVG